MLNTKHVSEYSPPTVISVVIAFVIAVVKSIVKHHIVIAIAIVISIVISVRSQNSEVFERNLLIVI